MIRVISSGYYWLKKKKKYTARNKQLRVPIYNIHTTKYNDNNIRLLHIYIHTYLIYCQYIYIHIFFCSILVDVSFNNVVIFSRWHDSHHNSSS